MGSFDSVAHSTVVVLDCGRKYIGEDNQEHFVPHTLAFAKHWSPVIGDDVWCPKCQDMRKVKDAPAHWNLKCFACRYAASGVAGEQRIRKAASAHSNKTGHRVAVRDGRNVKEIIGELGGQEELLSLADAKGVSVPQRIRSKIMGETTESVETGPRQ